MDPVLIAWLLEGDPAIRWQVQRDLLDADARSVERTRACVASQGWGARLLSLQAADGLWSGRLYNGKWTSTTYTLLLLRSMGLPPDTPRIRLACNALLEGGFRQDGRIVFARDAQAVDDAVTGMLLSILGYFEYRDARLRTVVDYLLYRQMADGRWEPYPGNTVLKYTFAATLLILDSLQACRGQYPAAAGEIDTAVAHGREYLLERRLYQDTHSGAPADASMTSFPFPPRWFYDVLTALDVFRTSGAERDERLSEAIALLMSKRSPDGTWKLSRPHAGKTFFEMEQAGMPSRWNTLRALRVLRWWENRSNVSSLL